MQINIACKIKYRVSNGRYLYMYIIVQPTRSPCRKKKLLEDKMTIYVTNKILYNNPLIRFEKKENKIRFFLNSYLKYYLELLAEIAWYI